MSAIELLKILLGVGAYVLGIFGIIGLFAEKGKGSLPNSFLILGTIALIIMFHI